MGYASCKSADALVLKIFSMVTDFLAAEKARGVKFCIMLAYYPDRSSPLLVNSGSRGVSGAVA